MKYYRQKRHYYQDRGEKVLHVNVGATILNLISFDEFVCSTEDVLEFQHESITEIEEDEFFIALDVVLISMEITLSR